MAEKMKFIAKEAKVFMYRDGRAQLICTVSPQMLTPNCIAEEIATAMNSMFGKK
jgi:hypothetical protein